MSASPDSAHEVCPESENLRENSESSGTLLFVSYLSFLLKKFSFTTFQTGFLFKGLSLYPSEPALRGSPTGKAQPLLPLHTGWALDCSHLPDALFTTKTCQLYINSNKLHTAPQNFTFQTNQNFKAPTCKPAILSMLGCPTVSCHWPTPARTAPRSTTPGLTRPLQLCRLCACGPGGCLEAGAWPHRWEAKTSRGWEPPWGRRAQHRGTWGPVLCPQEQCQWRGSDTGLCRVDAEASSSR